MQVFHPFATMKESIESLDRARLGKQRLECIQILLTNLDITDCWKIPKSVKNHPNTRLWKDYTYYLFIYLKFCLIEWDRRGYKGPKCKLAFSVISNAIHERQLFNTSKLYPDFLTVAFRFNQMLSLIEKNRNHYGELEWK